MQPFQPKLNVFIIAEGDVRPSEFLPMNAGNVRYRSLSSIYRASDLFVALRDRSNLKGKCARCEYREVCGGSRARPGQSPATCSPLTHFAPINHTRWRSQHELRAACHTLADQ